MQRIILKENISDSFELITYPDGQHTIRLNLEKLDIKKPVEIVCRIKRYSELEVLLCLCAALDKNDFYIEKIRFAYLFGMRSDRAFSIGEPNYFKQIIVPLLNKMPCTKEIVSPHSNKNLIYLSHTFASFPQFYLDNPLYTSLGGDESSKCAVSFKKKRETDKIKVCLDAKTIKYIEESIERFPDIIIYDDLVDGGETFIQESIYLKEMFGNRIKTINLSIAHGLFSKGIDHVANHFDHIYCTNSYQEISHPKVTTTNII